jgi:glycine cleavage system aminomethyltransferase T
MEQRQAEALKMLGGATRGRFVIYDLAGPSHGLTRAAILRRLTGANVPQSKAGVHALTDAFHALGGIAGDCIATREDNFIAWAKGVTA